MAREFDLHDARDRERMLRQMASALRKLNPELMAGERLTRSPPGYDSWAAHWAKAVAVELALAQAFLQTERPLLTPELSRDVRCFRLFRPKATLFSEEGPEIRSVVVADMRSKEGWLPANFQLAGGGLACIGLGEDGSTYLASCLLDPSARAQQPEHTDFSAAHWDWDADGVKGTAARMEQLAVHALLVQHHPPVLVSEGEVPPASCGKGSGGVERALWDSIESTNVEDCRGVPRRQLGLPPLGLAGRLSYSPRNPHGQPPDST
jgi:hypothetical protein